MIKIKKGLNIPINGKPAEEINDSKNSRSVAILGDDYIGMKPTMLVEEGDEVRLGQALFEDKKILESFLLLQPEVRLNQSTEVIEGPFSLLS